MLWLVLSWSALSILFAVGVCVALRNRREQRKRDLEQRVQQQIDSWTRDGPLEVLGARTAEPPGGGPAKAFILMFWNKTGVASGVATVRLIELQEGVQQRVLAVPAPGKAMPLKLLSRSELNAHRDHGGSRPLARLTLKPYERGEVELACVDGDRSAIIVQHETGEVAFPLEANDYLFILELSATDFRESFAIGFKRLSAEQDEWIASLPRSISKRNKSATALRDPLSK